MIAASAPIDTERAGSFAFAPVAAEEHAELHHVGEERDGTRQTVAATVMMSVSRFLMCASSCAMTPATSSRSSMVQQAGRRRTQPRERGYAPCRKGVRLVAVL